MMEGDKHQEHSLVLQKNLSLQISCLEKSLSVGYLEEGTGLVYLTKQKGNTWKNHGHVHNGRTVLKPEEALYLLECGALEVLVKGVPMSLQQAYHSLLNDELPLAVYQAYAFLKRSGYLVERVNVSNLSVSSSVCPLCADSAHKPERPRVQLLECRLSHSKTNPPPPVMRLLPARLDDPPPDPHVIGQLSRVQPSAGAFGVCIIDGTTLAYYSLCNSEINKIL